MDIHVENVDENIVLKITQKETETEVVLSAEDAKKLAKELTAAAESEHFRRMRNKPPYL